MALVSLDGRRGGEGPSMVAITRREIQFGIYEMHDFGLIYLQHLSGVYLMR